jgi:signal transduction histidine kinase
VSTFQDEKSSFPDPTTSQWETARLAALHSYQILDRPRPAVLDDLTRLAASIFDVPMALVALVDRDRQWHAGNTGMAEAQLPRELSFCARTLHAPRQLVVPDVARHPVFGGYPNVLGAPHIRFYAGAPLVDEDGFALGALCVLDDRPRDIADRQHDALRTLAAQVIGHLALIRTRLQVAALANQLALVSQREEDLVAAISHELRTPVTAIHGYLELLTDNDAVAPYRKLVDPIKRNGDRLVRIVDHLLAGARPADTAPPVRLDDVDLAAVAAAAVAACRPLPGRDTVPVTLVGTDAPVLARADAASMRRATEHLVRNAVLFTPAPGAVTVRVAADPQPTIEVTDTGVGIPGDELPYIFDRFYRGGHARRQAVPGVGLGLTVARRIVSAHDGTLTVTPTETGTTARITVPAVA